MASSKRPLLSLSRRAVAFGGVALASGAARAQARGDQARSFTILHTNDGHGRNAAISVAPGDATAQTGDPGRDDVEFEREGRIGGFPALATAVAARRAALGADRVVLVEGGDAFSDDLLGNLTKGEASIRLMNAVGYQFMALGNHDFDYGFERTRELARIAHFPMRAANVIERASGSPALGDPVQVMTLGGVTVALVALGYHNTHLTGGRDNVSALEFTSGIDAVRRLLPDLRRRAEAVVVVSHQGSKVDRKMLRDIEGIDVVIGAHSHDLITPPERIGGGWLTQALSDRTMLGEVTVTMRGGKVAGVHGQMHQLWADQIAEDTQVAALLQQLRAPHAKLLDEVVASATNRIGRQYRSESPFDKLVCRIMREETASDIGFMPGVGYGVSINPGPVTREALTTLLPHPTRMVTLSLTGAQVLEILNQSAWNQAPDDVMQTLGGLVQTDGLQWAANLRQPAGQRIDPVRVNGHPIELARSYRVATHTGMLDGLHRYASFAAGRDIRRQERTVSAAVEEAFRKAGTVSAPAIGDVQLTRAS